MGKMGRSVQLKKKKGFIPIGVSICVLADEGFDALKIAWYRVKIVNTVSMFSLAIQTP